MEKIRHVDTTGLPPKFDLADLVESGVTGDELIQWYRDRVKDGPPVIDRSKANAKPPPPQQQAQPKPAPQPSKKKTAEGNVVNIPAPGPDELADLPPEFSEDSLALKFTALYEGKLAYCGAWGKWVHWEGAKWEVDDTGLALDRARTVCRTAANEALARLELGGKHTTIANSLSTRRCFSNIEQIARTDRRHIVKSTEFDADPWIVNTPTGVVDLRTGELRKPRRSDWCIKTTAVGPGGKCPTWVNFLKQATEGDVELQTYLQRLAGYCLTGSICEHIFFFIYGPGGSGKGTFMNTLLWLLNTYSRVANMDTFTEQRFVRHSTELAYFQGSRLVTASEVNAGQRWNEARVKSMTGGDPITANYMHRDPFTFLPTFKLVFAGNHRPHLRNVDAAIKRRLYLVPFDYKVPKADIDGELDKKLQSEGGGILQWCIDGCMDWQANSLDAPPRVVASTAEYFEGEDKIGNFLDECCEVGSEFSERTTLIYERFVRWCEQQSDYSVSRQTFLEMLRTKGFVSSKRGGEAQIVGMRVVADQLPLPKHWQEQ